MKTRSRKTKKPSPAEEVPLERLEAHEARDERLRERLQLLESLPQELRDIFLEFLDAVLKVDEAIRQTRKRGGKS